jgi:hypothetical protein
VKWVSKPLVGIVSTDREQINEVKHTRTSKTESCQNGKRNDEGRRDENLKKKLRIKFRCFGFVMRKKYRSNAGKDKVQGKKRA